MLECTVDYLVAGKAVKEIKSGKKQKLNYIAKDQAKAELLASDAELPFEGNG